MKLFDYKDDTYLVGTTREVDTRKVSVHVATNANLRKAKVGQLVCLEFASAVDTWLIGIIEKVAKSVIISPSIPEHADGTEAGDESEEVVNTVKVTLVGTTRWSANRKKHQFTRSLIQVPEIESKCYILQEVYLEKFMSLLASQEKGEQSLEIGKYSIDESAKAYLDGNKFFQRHAALLGSTGSGKSWTVASILEKAAKLPSSNIIVFDLHGEYSNLCYAKQLKIPGPDELDASRDDLIFLPYWLLNAEELQAMFIDRSEFSAHNQVSKFQEIVIEGKKATLECLGKTELLKAFTLDSPIPFDIVKILDKIIDLNKEMVAGKNNTPKRGPFNGQFDRLIVRLKAKLEDRRYGFLFQAPESENEYGSMSKMVSKLLSFSKDNTRIKVINFSQVPSDILPVIVGLVARILYHIQFWTDENSRHPFALICDEAHLYLPKKDGRNPIEQRAIEAFEKIAKEGRKYGIALLIVSQRPSDVSTTVLSQCNNIIALRLTNGDDQTTVRKLMPESLESLLDVLPIMDIGEALVVGDSVLLPSRIYVNPPEHKPLSATIDFWSEWSKENKAPDFDRSIESMRKQSNSSST